MKKSTRTLLGASVSAVLGSMLLLGGSGTLAFWSDTETSATQQIQSGTLDLGSSNEITIGSNPTIKQCTTTSSCSTPQSYRGGAIVPGDVITATVSIPVTLIGENLRAGFAFTPVKAVNGSTAADAALNAAVSMTVKSIDGKAVTAAANTVASVDLGPTAKRSVPVVVEVSFPWGTSGQYNSAMGGKIKLSATYALTQKVA